MLKYMLNIFPAIPLHISQGMKFPLALTEVKSHLFGTDALSSLETIVITSDEEKEKETVRFGVTQVHSQSDKM